MTTVSALVTDPSGGVLLVRAPDGGRWALPSGPVLPGAAPRESCVRCVTAATGLVPKLGAPLVTGWYGDGRAGARATRLVFDGGRISASAVPRVRGLRAVPPEVRFVPPAELPSVAGAAEASVAEAALAARAGGRTAYLEDGRPPRVLELMTTYGIVPWVHSGSAWVWHPEPVPTEVPIRQSWVWVFAPDGRVVLYVDTAGHIGLPGGTLEPFEHRDPVAAAVREVREETQISITPPRYLGYLLDHPPGGGPVARVRMAAAITAVGPVAPDPATGTVHRRLLVPPQLIAEVCGWGPGADAQTAAAIRAGRALGVAEPDPEAPVTELPAGGVSGQPASI
ncbi:NUDIX domain-containing protein [Streptomyces sp. DSM 44915]|uniref:NUDIX domain-containing protein n=1 Tax=Streptomyces chisholmiae TaxID=3075540 RepID=A0ABU2JM98_9ACTN|nr:NUDIX domain-containing protein [Streptomyces sp. DSM 44915]MDT0266100.1 NUDIX domain-containing protein [Streptomyces sp. DSM 44915]